MGAFFSEICQKFKDSDHGFSEIFLSDHDFMEHGFRVKGSELSVDSSSDRGGIAPLGLEWYESSREENLFCRKNLN
jgi:hypothetical protein